MLSKEEKLKRQFFLMDKWMFLRNMGTSICRHEEIKNADRIAVYGLGRIGKRLLEELLNSKVNVAYALDRIKQVYISDIEVYAVSENPPRVDLLIVTPFTEYESIVDSIPRGVYGKAISVERIIDDLCEKEWNKGLGRTT